MSLRVRHCVECPKCKTWYLIAFSPYTNGAYLVRAGEGSGQEYTLYCLCDGADPPTRWRWCEVKTCEVVKPAHERGYGSRDEIWPIKRGLVRETRFGDDRHLKSEKNF